MSELLPCPLCGPGKVFLNPPSETYRHGSINCPACLLTLPGEIKDPREMIEVWNTRPAGWQPIETVPKDGTKVDLLYPYPRGRTNDCQWREGGVYGTGNWYWQTPTWGSQPGKGVGWHLLPESEWETHHYPNDEPTHWMTPPAPPEVKP